MRSAPNSMGVWPMGVAKQLSTLRMQVVFAGEGGGGFEIDDVQSRVGGGFQVDHFGIGPDGGFPGLRDRRH